MKYLGLVVGILCGVAAVLNVWTGNSGLAAFNGFVSGMNLVLAVWHNL